MQENDALLRLHLGPLTESDGREVGPWTEALERIEERCRANREAG